jgi:hypothetical protein
MGSEALSWADLLLMRLDAIQVFVLYFPSRLESAEDQTVRSVLNSFGRNTGTVTSVNFWDPTDPEFSRALQFFHVTTPPALIIARGLTTAGSSRQVARDDVYAIAITDARTLGESARLGVALNGAHEVLARGNSHEIAVYIRTKAVGELLAHLGSLGAAAVDQLIRLKPKFQLPGGVGLELGG